MIDRRNRQFMHRSKSMHLVMPIRTRLEQNSATTVARQAGLPDDPNSSSRALERTMSPLSNDRE